MNSRITKVKAHKCDNGSFNVDIVEEHYSQMWIGPTPEKFVVLTMGHQAFYLNTETGEVTEHDAFGNKLEE